MKALPRLALVAVVALAVAWFSRHPALLGEPSAAATQSAPQASGAPGAALERAPDLSHEASGTQLRVGGKVQRLLADDRDGSPHQRFIIATDSGITLLIAHNTALAPRLDGIAVGERVEVYGEYEWNDRGGAVHWTHKDPRGEHVAGYIEWRGRRYQ